MRLFNAQILDDFIVSAGGVTQYTSSEFESLLGACDTLAVQLVVSSVQGSSPQVGVTYESSSDGRTWSAAAAAVITLTSVNPNQINVLAGSYTAGTGLERVRLAIQVAGASNPGARVKAFATGRGDRGKAASASPGGCGCGGNCGGKAMSAAQAPARPNVIALPGHGQVQPPFTTPAYWRPSAKRLVRPLPPVSEPSDPKGAGRVNDPPTGPPCPPMVKAGDSWYPTENCGPLQQRPCGGCADGGCCYVHRRIPGLYTCSCIENYDLTPWGRDYVKA